MPLFNLQNWMMPGLLFIECRSATVSFVYSIDFSISLAPSADFLTTGRRRYYHLLNHNIVLAGVAIVNL